MIPEIQGWFNIQTSINIIHYINKLKKKNHLNIIQTESIWRNPSSIHGKNSWKHKTRRELPWLDRAFTQIYDIILNGEQLNAFPARLGTRHLASKIRQRNQRHIDRKGRNKTVPISRWHDCLGRKYQWIHPKLLELISRFSKVMGNKVNI